MKVFSLFQKGLVPAAVLLSSLGIASRVQATQVTAMTSGPDSGLDAILDELLPSVSPVALGADNFFTISFDEGTADQFVESVVLDLSSDTDAVFDNQDFFSFQAFPEIGSSFGINAAEISFSPVTRADFDNSSPTRMLEISFAAGSFGVGDSFTFGVDTNGVGDDTIPELAALSSLTNDAIETFNDTGSDFGLAQVSFSVFLESGESSTTVFENIGNFTSVASATFEENWQDDPNHSVLTENSVPAISIPPEEDASAGTAPETVVETSDAWDDLATFNSLTGELTTTVPEPATACALFLLGGLGFAKRKLRSGN